MGGDDAGDGEVLHGSGEGSGTAVIYGVVQCNLTLMLAQCTNCSRLAYVNIQGCPPAAGATPVDVEFIMSVGPRARRKKVCVFVSQKHESLSVPI